MWIKRISQRAVLVAAALLAQAAHGNTLEAQVVAAFKALGHPDYLLAHVTAKKTLVPGQQNAWAHPVTAKDKLIGFVKPTSGGRLSLLYDDKGTARGNPYKLALDTRGSLLALGVIDRGSTKEVALDLSNLVSIPNRKDKQGYRMTVDGIPMGFVASTKRGHLSRMYDLDGSDRGNPHRLVSGARVSLVTLGMVRDGDEEDVSVDLSGVVPIPGHKDEQGYRAARGGVTLAFVQAAPGGNLSRVYDAEGRNHGNPAQLVSQLRSSLIALDLVHDAAAERLLVDLTKAVTIPNQKETHGYRVTLDGRLVAFAQATSGGYLSRIYDSRGQNRGNPAQLLSSVRSSLMSLGLIDAEAAEELTVDFVKTVPIPHQREMYGYRVTLDGAAVGFAKTASGGTLSIIYDADGRDRGNPARLVSMVRGNLVALGMVDKTAIERAAVDFSEPVPIPTRANEPNVQGFPVTLDGELIAFAETSSGGTLASLYDVDGQVRGKVTTLRSEVRSSLAMLKLMDERKGDIFDADLSQQVPIPNRPGATGHQVMINGKTVAFAKIRSREGRLSLLYDTTGRILGNPVAAVTQTRSALIALKLLESGTVGKLQLDMGTPVPIPNQNGNLGYAVTVSSAPLAFIKTSPGGSLSVLYDAHGKNRGNPAQLVSDIHASLALLGLGDANDGETADIDLSRLVQVPNQVGVRAYAVTVGGKPIAFAKAASGGHLAVIYDHGGKSLGHPVRLASDARSSLLTLNLIDSAAAGRVVVDHLNTVTIPHRPDQASQGYQASQPEPPSKKDPQGHAITVDGVTMGFAQTTPNGHMTQFYDAEGRNHGNPARLTAHLRAGLVALDVIDKSSAERMTVDFSGMTTIPNQQDIQGYRVMLDLKVVAFVKVTSSGKLSLLYDLRGQNRGNPVSLISQIRKSLSALGVIDDAEERLAVDLSKLVTIPNQPHRPDRSHQQGYLVTLDEEPIAFATAAPSGTLSRIYDVEGKDRGNPAHLVYHLRSSLAALGIIAETAPGLAEGQGPVDDDLEVEFAKPVAIPGQKGVTGYRVKQRGTTIAFAKSSVGGHLSLVYDANGVNRGNPGALLSQVRTSLLALAMAPESAMDRVVIDLAEPVPIPMQKEALGYRIRIDGATVAFAKTAMGGTLQRIYDVNGNSRGNPAQLIPHTRGSLVALKLVDAAELEKVAVDFSELVPIPNQKEAQGYQVTVNQSPVAFVKVTKNGNASAVYDMNGTNRGNSGQLVSQMRNSLVALNLIQGDAADRVSVDLSHVVDVPNQKSTQGYLATLDGAPVGYAKVTAGGSLSLVYDIEGRNRGNPAQFVYTARSGLRLLGVVEDGDDIDIDLTGKAPHPVFKDGNLVAHATPAAGGNLSKLWDKNGVNDWGNPAKLRSEFRWVIRQLRDIKEAEVPLLELSFDAVLSGEKISDLPVKDSAGKTRYYVVPHPRSGHLLKILDANKSAIYQRKGREKHGRLGLH